MQNGEKTVNSQFLYHSEKKENVKKFVGKVEVLDFIFLELTCEKENRFEIFKYAGKKLSNSTLQVSLEYVQTCVCNGCAICISSGCIHMWYITYI